MNARLQKLKNVLLSCVEMRDISLDGDLEGFVFKTFDTEAGEIIASMRALAAGVARKPGTLGVYVHNCAGCVYLATLQENGDTLDLYVHVGEASIHDGMGPIAIVTRWGDRQQSIHQAHDGMAEALADQSLVAHPFVVAWRLAQERGIIPNKEPTK